MRRWREIVVCERCKKESVGNDVPDNVPMPRLRSVYLWTEDGPAFYRVEDFALCHSCAGAVFKMLTNIAKPDNGA